jgi:hypothetical protein
MRQDRAELMNCPVDYDDEVERLRTHPKLLSKAEGPVDPQLLDKTINANDSRMANDRRSVLDKVQNDNKMQRVTWNTSQNKVDRSNAKVRTRHVELVIARVLRDKSAMAHLRATRGLE